MAEVVVAELGLAPGKSMRAYDNVPEICIGANGLVLGDRHYMWVEAKPHVNQNYRKREIAQTGHFLSQREDPVLTGVIPLLQDSGVLLQFRDGGESLSVPIVEDTEDTRKDVSVWGWSGQAIDQGNDAADWGEAHIGRPVRLVAVSNKMPRYVEDDPIFGRVGFADGYPVTVGSVETNRLINEFLASIGKPPVTAQTARMTMLLDGLEHPNRDQLPEVIFLEDYIRSITVASDGLKVVLTRIKACGRCPIPDTDQISGERSKGRPVLRTLNGLGRHGRHLDADRYGTDAEVFWTQNFVINVPDDMPPDASITIARSSVVEVEYTNTTNWVPLTK